MKSSHHSLLKDPKDNILSSLFLKRATGANRSCHSFCNERWEQIAPVFLILKSDRSDSHQLIFFKEQIERKSTERKSEFPTLQFSHLYSQFSWQDSQFSRQDSQFLRQDSQFSWQKSQFSQHLANYPIAPDANNTSLVICKIVYKSHGEGDRV